MESVKADDDSGDDVMEVKKSSESREKGAGIFSGTFNLSNAALGAGVLTFPDQFARTSILSGVLMNILFVGLVFVGLNILGQTAKITASETLSVAVRRVFGKNMERLAIILLIAYCWTSTVQFLTTIGTSVTSFGLAVAGRENENDNANLPWYLTSYFTISVVSIVFVYPLTLLKSMSTLAWSSSIAIMAVSYNTLFVLVTAFVYSDQVSKRADTPPGGDQSCNRMERDDGMLDRSFWRVVPTIASMCLGYQCHLSSFCNYSSLRPKTKVIYPYIILVGSLVCFVTYTTVGIAGASLFGGCTNKWILKNYALNDTGANIGRALIAVAVAFSYPILAFTGRREILRLFDTLSAARNWEFSENNIFVGTVNRRFFWVSSIYFFTNLVAALFISLESAIQLVGTSAAAWMFIYPGLFAMKLSYLTHEGTIDEALSQLPDSPHEELVDSWVNGIRNRVTWWLSGWQRIALWWSGLIFAVIGFLLLVIGFTQFVRDMAGY
eukprot:GEMP01007242.1.p1 GENE.GEMP01007242.1~~GEMP01007242.1.p1  ORF type:complete len:495 (+),score=59.29 GEMP01007242.1:152-1636(+)